MEEQSALLELIKFVQGATPALWEMAKRQAMIDGIVSLFGLAIAILFLAVGVYSARMILTGEGRYDDEVYEITILVILILVPTLLAGTLSPSLTFLFNPDYYALQQLLQLIPSG